MPVDRRVEEAFGLLSRPGGPTADELRRARALMREWLDEGELADEAGEDDPATWADVPPLEVLNLQRTVAPRLASLKRSKPRS